MGTVIPLRLLLVGTLAPDRERIEAELRRGGFEPDARLVPDAAGAPAALAHGPQLVISDHSPPRLDGLAALAIVAAEQPELPFILVSGTASEELAVTALHAGASDFVPRDRLARLAPSVRRALEHSQARQERRRAEAALREREAHLRAILDNEPECVKVVGLDGRLIEMNRAGLRMLEAESIEQVRDRGLASFVKPAHRERLARSLALGAGRPTRVEMEIEGLRGARRVVEVYSAPLAVDGAPVAQVVSVARDVTERRLAEARLLRLNRMHALLGGINSVMVRSQRREELLREACRLAAVRGEFARAWIATLGGAALALRVAAACGPDGAPLAPADAALLLEGRDGALVERCLRQGRIERSGQTVALPLVRDGEPVGAMVLVAHEAWSFDEEELVLLGDLAGDISFALAHHEMRERVAYAALHDTVTGLPNRNLLADRVDQALRAAARKGRRVAVAYLGFGRLGLVTESLGRQAGDELLRRVAERLGGAVRPLDTLARVSDRTFAVLVDGISDPVEVVALFNERIVPAFEPPVPAGGREFHLRVRAGVAVGEANAGGESLCDNAEQALRSVRASADRIAIHEPAMTARAAESFSLEQRLRHALEREELVLHYQPIVSAATGALTGLEALLRWSDPGHGLVSPARFVPLMEETGLILEAGRWVLRRAAHDVRLWRSRGLRVPPVAVNVSSLQLAEPGFADDVSAALRLFEPGERILSVEITESVLVSSMDRAAAALGRLRALGVETAIDDFGTGYSSLAYVAALPIDSLKVDRSFVAGMAGSGTGRTIVTTVVALGHALGLTVVAEGVETDEQARWLRELGCDQLQGYALGRPVEASAVASLLAVH